VLKKLDHIGIAVHSLEPVKSFFQNIFNMSPVFEETVKEQKVRVAGFKVGETNLEFLEPTAEDSPIARYLEKRGEGLHHIALGVDDISDILNQLKEKGLRLIDETPREGAEGKHIAFIHPKSIFGILTELSQE
jgi:methylmalonyl-CoA/ethylmalonyl-CoA epimerase